MSKRIRSTITQTFCLNKRFLLDDMFFSVFPDFIEASLDVWKG